MTKVLNAFSFQMVGAAGHLEWETIPSEAASQLLRKEGVDSYIGHVDTAAVVSNELDVEVPFARRFATLSPGERALIAQVKGGRLPEGATSLPEGMRVEFLLVSYDA